MRYTEDELEDKLEVNMVPEIIQDGNTAGAFLYWCIFYICKFSENMHCLKWEQKQRNKVKKEADFRRMRYHGVFGLEKQGKWKDPGIGFLGHSAKY